MIELKCINGDNIDELVALEVSEEQKDLMASTILRSFADAYEMNKDGVTTAPYAVYVEDKLVGFSMYIYDIMDHESFVNETFFGKNSYFIWHFMIDRNYQGQGYGKLALEKTIEDIMTKPFGQADYIVLFYNMKNIRAKKLYESFGFTDTGIVMDGSMLAIKKLT